VNLSITQHARQNNEREVGGVLLGDVRRDEKGWLYLVVTHALQAEFANETRGHLTFTHHTWLKIHRTREAQYPDKAIVGWYHTHPGWTIFLSQWDLFIHQNFFKQPWQIALVIDPSVDRAGFFVWNGDRVDNPDTPVAPFRLAELDGWKETLRPRVRIKLTDPPVRLGR
jgi:proteasome lid subunit RPN8/RPN11